MAKLSGGQTDFRDWVDGQPNPNWPPMPLTHIAKALTAADIAKSGFVDLTDCDVFGKPLAYFFYGRPGVSRQRRRRDKNRGCMSMLLHFQRETYRESRSHLPVYTGAFSKRLYNHMLTDEMAVEDFSLAKDVSRPNKLIMKTFGSRLAYFQGDIYAIPDPATVTKSYEFHARSYLNLLTSPGATSPTIEYAQSKLSYLKKCR